MAQEPERPQHGVGVDAAARPRSFAAERRSPGAGLACRDRAADVGRHLIVRGEISGNFSRADALFLAKALAYHKG